MAEPTRDPVPLTPGEHADLDALYNDILGTPERD